MFSRFFPRTWMRTTKATKDGTEVAVTCVDHKTVLESFPKFVPTVTDMTMHLSEVCLLCHVKQSQISFCPCEHHLCDLCYADTVSEFTSDASQQHLHCPICYITVDTLKKVVEVDEKVDLSDKEDQEASECEEPQLEDHSIEPLILSFPVDVPGLAQLSTQEFALKHLRGKSLSISHTISIQHDEGNEHAKPIHLVFEQPKRHSMYQ